MNAPSSRPLFTVLFSFFAATLCAAPASAAFSPLQTGVVPPDWQLVSEDTPVIGLRINLPLSANETVAGLDLGFLSSTKTFSGIRLNLGAYSEKSCHGLALGLLDFAGTFKGIQFGACEVVAETLDGIQVAGFGLAETVHGIQICAVSSAGSVQGLQFALANRIEFLHGLQIGLYNNVGRGCFWLEEQCGLPADSGTVHGVQIGGVNAAETMNGLQIGLWNVAKTLHGVQIGLLNIVPGSPFPFLPLLRASF